MLINLIKLFQSAAGRSNFKQACKLMTHSGEKSPVCLFPSLLNTTIVHLRARAGS